MFSQRTLLPTSLKFAAHKLEIRTFWHGFFFSDSSLASAWGFCRSRRAREPVRGARGGTGGRGNQQRAQQLLQGAAHHEQLIHGILLRADREDVFRRLCHDRAGARGLVPHGHPQLEHVFEDPRRGPQLRRLGARRRRLPRLFGGFRAFRHLRRDHSGEVGALAEQQRRQHRVDVVGLRPPGIERRGFELDGTARAHDGAFGERHGCRETLQFCRWSGESDPDRARYRRQSLQECSHPAAFKSLQSPPAALEGPHTAPLCSSLLLRAAPVSSIVGCATTASLLSVVLKISEAGTHGAPVCHSPTGHLGLPRATTALLVSAVCMRNLRNLGAAKRWTPRGTHAQRTHRLTHSTDSH